MSFAWLFLVVACCGFDPSNGAGDCAGTALAEPNLNGPKDTLSFATDIIPILTKAGCNAGACHGSAAGRGEFRLSLFGSDPAADYNAIVHQFEGRRINLAKPEASLVLRKPSGDLDHEGGAPLLDDAIGRVALLRWIRSGAPVGPAQSLIELRIQHKHVLETVPSALPLQVEAIFDDNTKTDVTRWTVFTVSDPSAIRVEDAPDTATPQVHVSKRGQHVLIARYLDRVVPITISVPFNDTPVDSSKVVRVNFIDDQILRKLDELRIPDSPDADNFTWVRRVTLDLTGQLPEPQDIRQFLESNSKSKREELVDRLLNSDAFADLWTLRFSRLLRMHSLPNESEALAVYSSWLRDFIRSDREFDQLARELLTTMGDSHVVGPANFSRMVADARGQAELVGQFFAGIRLGCANCHNHPLDKWTQDDYHGLAAVFAPVDRGREVRLLSRGQVTNLRTGEPAIPRIPGVRYLPPDADRLQAVVDWVINDQEKLFARATVNRLWRFLFGRGLVEPTDDVRDTNLATHPELLNELAEEFASNDYRLKRILKTIVLSATYGRSCQTIPGNEADDRFYSHAARRALEPEVLLDAIADVTGVAGSYPSHNADRAVQVVDAAVPADDLDVLGRCQKVSGCIESESGTGGLAAQLRLLNGDAINKRLRDSEGRLSRLIAAGHSLADIVDEFYVRGFGRHATDAEQKTWLTNIEHPNPMEQQQRLEDFVWSLLNSREFRENY